MEQNQQYQLGSWKICPRTNTVKNQTESHAIDNKSMQVLLFLIEHKGEPVSKEQILEQVWKNKFVADDILSVTVSKIRKALGDNARSPSFIKTLPGKGYVLIAEAQKIDETAQKSDKKVLFFSAALLFVVVAGLVGYFFFQDEDAPANQLNINSIAVLPFDDLSFAKDNQFFTDGLSDAIINQLSQIKSLKVISRYSSFTYREKYEAADIGQALQVETLLDGSVQTIDDQVRINVRIFSTENGQQLWSETFDGDSEDIFTLQDNISSDIKALIQPGYRTASSKPITTVNAQAYEWYLMGQYHWRQRNPEALAKAVTYFTHSLESEPNYADAHVGLAITYALLHTYGNWGESRAIEAALPHVNNALALKPNSARALAAKGLILTVKAVYKTHSEQADPTLYQQAQQAFERSLQLENNATTHRWYSGLLRRIGSESDVIWHLNKAVALNPLSASLKRSFSFTLRSMGKPDSAQRMYQSALRLEPAYFSRLIESSRINRYTAQSIADMSVWHQDNPDLFSECASDEYCEHVVFNYLSIGAKDAAETILSAMGSTHFHFRTSLNAIAASATGDELEALKVIERFAQRNPNSRRTSFDHAIAQFRAGQYEQTETTLLQLYPQWRDESPMAMNDINADNYRTLVLYAATLSKLQKQTAERLLQNLQIFLHQDRVFDKTDAEFTLAEINAQSGNIQQALVHLESALNMGWMETYRKEWWSLGNNHLLQPLFDQLEFKVLLQQHEEKREMLREVVSHNLNANSGLAE